MYELGTMPLNWKSTTNWRYYNYIEDTVRTNRWTDIQTDPDYDTDDPNKKPLGSDDPSTGIERLLGPPHGRLPPLPPLPRNMSNAKVAPMPLTDGDTAAIERSPEKWKAIMDSFCVEKHRSRREIFDNEAGKEEVHHNGRHRRRQENYSTERQVGKKRKRVKRFFSKNKLHKHMEQLAFPDVDKATPSAARSTVVASRHLPGGGTICQVKTISELDRILSAESSDISAGPSMSKGDASPTGAPGTPDDSPRVKVISAMLSDGDATPPPPPRDRQEGGANTGRPAASGSDIRNQADHKSSGTLKHIRDFADRYLSRKKKPTKTKVKVFKPCKADDKPAGKIQNLRDFAERFLSHNKPRKPSKTKVQSFTVCDSEAPNHRGLWSRLFHKK